MTDQPQNAEQPADQPATLPSNLPAPLLSALTARGFASLTSVQQAVIEPKYDGADLLVSAQTGSGKTVAFGLALAPEILGGADRLGPPDLPLALVIAPTRELALQVQRELEWLYAETGAVIASCVGGMDARAERRALDRGAHIVVGTPGRLCDHLRRGSLDLTVLRAAVLDEADEMLDLGFREDLEFLLDAAPADRRTLLFSATVRREIEQLATRYQRDAQRIATAGQRDQHGDISYRGILVDTADRENAIVNLLRFHEAQTAIVFCGTRATVTHLTARFQNRGFSVVALSGELDQRDRAHALQALRDGRARVCIATDVAARGIDLPGLELVVHADLPTNKEALLHRSGRTGRAGAKGTSALIVPQNQRRKAERLLGFAGVTAEWGPAPSAESVLERDAERLLQSAELNAPVSDDEAAKLAGLMELPQRQLAAAVLRLYSAGLSAPEELRGVEADGGKTRPSLGPAFWVVLSVGHEDRAEARWLLPLLCRTGDLTKRDIGAIRIGRQETLVEIAAGAEKSFFNGIGPSMELEGGITVTRHEGEPQGTWNNPEAAPRAHKPMGRGKPRRDDFRGERSDGDRPRSDRPKYDKPKYDGPRGDGPRGDGPRGGKKPWAKPAEGGEGDGARSWDKPRGAKPAGKFGGKPGGKPGSKYGTPSGRGGAKFGGKPGAKRPGKPRD